MRILQRLLGVSASNQGQCFVRVAFVLAVKLYLASTLGAQGSTPPIREIRGLDFRPNGVWRPLGRQVRTRRAQLLAQGAFAALNAPIRLGAPVATAAAVAGVLNVPVIAFHHQDIPSYFTAQDYLGVLFGTVPPMGRPYTFRSYFLQLSSGLLDIQGDVYGPVTLSKNEVVYAGLPPCFGNPYGTSNCNGIFDNGSSPPPIFWMHTALREAIRNVDSIVNFVPYADTSGYVPLVVFIQPAQDGARLRTDPRKAVP